MADEAEPGFEAAIASLEGIVETLEAGELELDEALARYQAGVGLVARCKSLLDGAEARVAILSGVDPVGVAETTPFDASATIAPEPTPTKGRGRASK